MRAYLVRLIKTRDLVGIFVATDRNQLQHFVDECADIDYCEYAPLPAGGVFWESPAIPIPVPEAEAETSNGEDGESSGPRVPWGDLTPSDSWFIALHEPIPRWRPLYQEGDDFPILVMDKADEAAAGNQKARRKAPHLRLIK